MAHRQPARAPLLAAALAMTLTLTSDPATAGAGDMPVPNRVVATSHGPVQGLIESGISAYKGIPYAAPPTGAARFKAPRAPVDRTGILDAIAYGASCMQMYDRGIATDLSLQLATVFTTLSEMKSDNEDCLFLNVWTPAPDERARPVMVWFHGGGWNYGSGAWPVYDGTNLARRGDVVVVTVNHRLNVFGYLDLSAHDGDAYRDSANAGLLDMVMALEWVRDNAAAFGGDPDNVTIMGESGGGSKVSHLLATPAAKGLFHKAVIQSGPALTAIERDAAREVADAVVTELGLGDAPLEALRTLPAQTILDAASTVADRVTAAGARRALAPVIDDRVLPAHPFTPAAPAQSRDVPILIGWNKDEFTIFNAGAPWFGTLTKAQMMTRLTGMVGARATALAAAYEAAHPDYSPTYLFNMILGDMRMFLGSVTLAERKAAQGGAPVFMYYLTWETPVGNGVFKTPHTLDMPMMFANVDRSLGLTGDSTEARLLEAQMSSSWIAFARTGDPSNDTVPAWPAYDGDDRATMQFDVTPRLVNAPKQALLERLRD
ncbi:MAG TPA: carboxylesterase/lipase family protein [Pseudomonadales bacterium]|nr:carboxylesterase/lipase family protein [Pseudomonadales bacterium]